MFTFTINVPTWSQGGSSLLLSEEDGCRCCLGFYLGAVGIPPYDLADVSTPSEVSARLPLRTRWLLQEKTGNSHAALLLMNENDESPPTFFPPSCGYTKNDYYTWLLAKMRTITEHFAAQDIAVMWDGIA